MSECEDQSMMGSDTSIEECVRTALRLADAVDPALLNQLPFRAGFFTAEQIRRARELAEKFNLPFSQSTP